VLLGFLSFLFQHKSFRLILAGLPTRINRQQTDTAPAVQKRHRCFENSQAAKGAFLRLSLNYREWLTEDAVGVEGWP
jgi:hypothetical protein